MVFTAKIEQTFAYPKRMKYIAKYDTFIPKDCESLSYIRNVKQPSGWIVESGTPPCEHLDVIVMTDKEYNLGDEEKVKIVGVFCRNDGDHKLVAVPICREVNDFSELYESEKEDMHRFYPFEDIGEGWFGKERAEEIIKDFFCKKKSKDIILIQHTESQHHVNGMIGAWGDWELTEYGKSQAYEIGKWLLKEGCNNRYSMYVSDLKRTMQTAEEINKSLEITPIVYEVIREVNAGEGNGKPREWYRANEAPHKEYYNPDYKPFPDAESDRDLWERIYPFYQEIMSNDMEKMIIVSHGTTLSFLQSMIMGYKFEDIERFRFNGAGGSISRFAVEKNGKVTARYINYKVC